MKQPVQFTPWRSIRDGIVAPVEGSKSYAASLASPCFSCATSPCCTHLPLHNFRVNSLGDLNYAGYLLNFAFLRLGLARNGEWSVYYAYPCRFLDQATFNCRLHDSPLQPRICVNYNPYGCWYRKVFASESNSDLVLVDRARFLRLTEMLAFDEHQQITDAPDFDMVVEVLAGVLEGPNDDTAERVPSLSDVAESAFGRTSDGDSALSTGSAGGDTVMGAHQARSVSPCDACRAPCCETLVFPQGLPSMASGFDWFRFCLGFPGIELSIGPDHWSVVVKTRCQHLDNGRCSIYGKPERPLFCRYYDEWKCTYRTEFGETPSPNTFPVRLEQFDKLLECFDVDRTGAVVAVSTFSAMREHVAASGPHDAAADSTAGRPGPSGTTGTGTMPDASSTGSPGPAAVTITAKPKAARSGG